MDSDWNPGKLRTSRFPITLGNFLGKIDKHLSKARKKSNFHGNPSPLPFLPMIRKPAPRIKRPQTYALSPLPQT